jgi:hypothetical protein
MVDENKLKDLKAAGYDTLAQIEILQKRLGQINQAIKEEYERGNNSPEVPTNIPPAS